MNIFPSFPSRDYSTIVVPRIYDYGSLTHIHTKHPMWCSPLDNYYFHVVSSATAGLLPFVKIDRQQYKCWTGTCTVQKYWQKYGFELVE